MTIELLMLNYCLSPASKARLFPSDNMHTLNENLDKLSSCTYCGHIFKQKFLNIVAPKYI